MNIIKVPVILLPDIPVMGTIISANELIKFFTANDVIKTAEKKAEAIYQEAQNYIDKIKIECENLRQVAYQEGNELLENEKREIRQQVVADTVEWLVSEHQLEQEIMMNLEVRIQGLITSILESFFIESNQAELLSKQLKNRLKIMNNEKSAILYVHSSLHDELEKQFSDYPWLSIVCDDTQGKEEALLSSPLFNLHINLKEQLRLICSRLLLLK